MQLAQLFSQIWKKKEINLLPESDFDNSVVGQVLNWAIEIGKWIVVGVEMVVISVFVIRLSIDRKRVALTKKVQQQVAQIQAYDEFEKEFRLLQKRTEIAGKVIPQEEKKKATFDLLSQLIPMGVWVEKITISENRLSLSAYASSLYSFSQMLSNIEKSQKFDKIILQNVKSANKSEASLQFSLSLEGK